MASAVEKIHPLIHPPHTYLFSFHSLRVCRRSDATNYSTAALLSHFAPEYISRKGRPLVTFDAQKPTAIQLQPGLPSQFTIGHRWYVLAEAISRFMIYKPLVVV
jgi:hypothetical protein